MIGKTLNETKDCEQKKTNAAEIFFGIMNIAIKCKYNDNDQQQEWEEAEKKKRKTNASASIIKYSDAIGKELEKASCENNNRLNLAIELVDMLSVKECKDTENTKRKKRMKKRKRH